ncbi:hypothetical protein K438DRAFT_1984292 [Mycena galopus ATCC 62051]|nr:hypothetical protein K438DRAFT_1984292 [Mycena galopus ATCC 62051]
MTQCLLYSASEQNLRHEKFRLPASGPRGDWPTFLSPPTLPTKFDLEAELESSPSTLRGAPAFFPYGYHDTPPPERSTWSPSSSITAEQEHRQHSVQFDAATHQREEEKALRTQQSSPDLRRQKPSCCPRYPEAFHINPPIYSQYRPPSFYSREEESVTRLNSFSAFQRENNRQILGQVIVGDTTGTHQFPEYVWKCYDEEGVFHLRTPTSRRLQAGDEIDCNRLLEGTWTLTNKIVRSCEWSVTVPQQPQEWVKVMCCNYSTKQEAWLKIDAAYFYPSTVGILYCHTLFKVKLFIVLRWETAFTSEEPDLQVSIDGRYLGPDH